MRLSAEEYARGLVSWEAAGESTVCTATASEEGTQPEWSDPLTDPAGSLVTSAAHRFRCMRFGSQDPTVLAKPYRVRWEWVVGPMLLTRVWDSAVGPEPITLIGIPNYGIFHRLVVCTPGLQWPVDSAIRVDDIVVRFVEGVVRGERVSPMDRIEIKDGKPLVSGDFSGEEQASSRFIEIVAPGGDAERAKIQAHTILGCLALCLGEGAVGDIIFSEPHKGSAEGHTSEFYIPVTAALPVPIGEEHIDSAAQAMPTLLQNDKASRACRLALRWYEHGVRAGNPTDRLLAHFIGIEALLNSHASRMGPSPQLQATEKRFADWLTTLPGPLDPGIEQWFRNTTVRTFLADHLAFYVVTHGWESELNDRFRVMRRIRNEIVHGEAAGISESQADEVQRLHRRLLANELSVTTEVPVSPYPDVRGITVEFAYTTEPQADDLPHIDATSADDQEAEE